MGCSGPSRALEKAALEPLEKAAWEPLWGALVARGRAGLLSLLNFALNWEWIGGLSRVSAELF